MIEFEHLINDFLAVITGPLSFRFIVQPAVAMVLAIRDGRVDAKLHRKPFFWSIVSNPSQRMKSITNALHSVLSPIIIGICTDAVAQYMIFKHVRIVTAIFVGSVIISLPYVLVRGITNRICIMKYHE